MLTYLNVMRFLIEPHFTVTLSKGKGDMLTFGLVFA